MASISKEKRTKDGRRYHVISVSRGYGVTPYTMRWYRQPGWSDKYAESRLKSDAGKFEADCKAGLILNRAEQKQKDAEAAAEAAKLKTVKQYGNDVYMVKKKMKSENTRTSYQSMLDLNVYPYIGNVLMTDVTTAMCDSVITKYQSKGYAHSSVVKLYTVMCGLFDMAFMNDSIPISPMLKVKRPEPRDDEVPQEESEKAYTESELNYILDCVAQEPLKWQTYVCVMADMGLRRGECCGLQWEDIDFKTGDVTIRHNLQYTVSAGVYDKRPKNKKVRVVDVGDDVLQLLRALRKEQAETAISKWVFTQDGTSKPMFPQSPNKYFKKFGEKYGVKDFHPHKLRHTSASVMITNNADVASVSERLGHSDKAVTLRMYSHANQESIRQAGQKQRDALKARREKEHQEPQKAENE